MKSTQHIWELCLGNSSKFFENELHPHKSHIKSNIFLFWSLLLLFNRKDAVFCDMVDFGAKCIADALKTNHSLKKLNFCSLVPFFTKFSGFFKSCVLDGNYIGDEGARQIFEALKVNKSVTRLDLCLQKKALFFFLKF